MKSVVIWLGSICALAAGMPVQAQSPLTITTSSPLPNATLQVSYSTTLQASGGVAPYTWSIGSGSLPPGLSLSSGGVISGVPTQTGTSTFVINAVDSSTQPQVTRKQFDLTVQTPPLRITSASPLPGGSPGVSYAYTLSATGGKPPYTWQLASGSLPAGLSLSSGGQISGVPSTAGTAQFSVAVYDTQESTASQSFTLTIQAPPLTIITTSPLPSGSAGVNYSATLSATGGTPPYNWSASGSLPPGLTLAANGVLSGSPTASGNYTFTAQVSDSSGQNYAGQSISKTFSVRITAPLTVTTPSPLAGTAGSSLTIVMTANGGVLPEIWQVAAGSQLPPGLSLDTVSGFLQGTPATAGTYTFTVQVSDNAGGTATKALTMVVAPALSITTASPAPVATAGAAYSLTFAAAGGSPPLAWKLDSGTLPAGLTLDPATGILSGTPASAAVYSLPIRVTDAANATVAKTFALTVNAPGPGGQTSAASLDFTAPAGGDAPAPQSLALNSLGPQALTFTVQLDGGPGVPAPAWLAARPPKGATPAQISISVDQTGLQPGTYSGRVLVKTSDGQQSIVTVTLTVAAAEPQLDISPPYIRYSGTAASIDGAEQDLVLRNTGGGGPIAFRAAVVGNAPWLSVTPDSGQTSPNAPVYLRVVISAAGLTAGAQNTFVRITSAAGTVDVPVSALTRPGGPAIAIDQQGVRFDTRAGNGDTGFETVDILNTGDSALNWHAEVLSSDRWLALSAPDGQTAPGASSSLTLRVATGGLDPGGHYALVRISDPDAVNSPQYFTAVLNVQKAETPAGPHPVPEGLVFVTRAGTAPPPQTVTVFTSSSTAVAFQAAANPAGGGIWLTVTPAGGSTQTQPPAQVSVGINPAGLAAGVYTGAITISFSSTLVQTTNVTLIVQPPAPAGARSAKAPRDAVAGCAPARLALTSTGLNNSFISPAGWPTSLAVALSDDCGAPVVNGQVVATFSNGDPALVMKLTDPNTATYSGTWSPRNVTNAVTVTARANAPALASTSADILGAVTANKVPVLSTNGTLNNLHPVVGAPIAPGTVAQVFGSNLAPSQVEPGVVPLPPAFNGTQVLVGAFPAPLYFLSDGQLNVQLPPELQAGKEYPVIVAANGGYTLPDSITTSAANPGLAVLADNTVIAQHPDFSLVTAVSPAAAGEAITLYLVGMGATNPAVASGAASPAGPLASVTAPVTVTIGGRQASILFAGLTPGAVGLYQINLIVPSGLGAGQLPLVITQGGATANNATLPVK